MVKRPNTLQRIIPFIDNSLVKVVTGIRRSGKTFLLHQIQDLLLIRGVGQNQIISINFESRAYKDLNTTDTLYDFVKDQIEKNNPSKKSYIFLDEIQHVEKWELAVNSFRVDFDCDIYITGSNSKLLSGELATHLAGRYVSFCVYPFTFKEAKEYSIQNKTFTTNEALFADYIKYGGFPQRFQMKDESSTEIYLEDIFNSVVLKDVIDRNKINNVPLLQKLCTFLLDNIGNPFSANSIVNKFKSEKIAISTDTVLNYISYIETAFILFAVPRYDITGKKLLESNEKYYSADIGLRNIARTSEKIDVNKLYENIVFLELKERGWNVNVGKLGDNEIDFICYRGKEKIYIQVAYLITEQDEKREFGNLEKISDSYPKYVISSDLVDMSRNGIIHKNIINWLLEE